MKKLFAKSELLFFLLWMFVYVLLQQVGDALTPVLGSAWYGKALLNLLLSLFLFFWVRKEGLLTYYGLGKISVSAREMLWFLPLILVSSSNFWRGASLQQAPAEAAAAVLCMAAVGFLEEILLRGFLFRSLQKDSLRQAVLISTLAFSAGHILNLFSGRMGLVDNLFQLTLALCLGLLYALILVRSGSLLPCIASHCAIDMLSVFSPRDGISLASRLTVSGIEILIMALYILYLLKPGTNTKTQAV